MQNFNPEEHFNPEELCSSKLFEIVRAKSSETGSKDELEAAIAELASRRHYLSELEQLDKLSLKKA